MTGREMPRYLCHKEVWALKIKDLCVKTKTHPFTEASTEQVRTYTELAAVPYGQEATLDYGIVPDEPGYDIVWLGASWFARHNPQQGGYLVVYKDGYSSYSPAAAFEEGYTRI